MFKIVLAGIKFFNAVSCMSVDRGKGSNDNKIKFWYILNFFSYVVLFYNISNF
jgi:hypothetical protein